jgi:hypothetical protein
MDCSPHSVISKECRIHQQHMSHKLIVGVKVRQVIEHHERVIKSDSGEQQQFRPTDGHGLQHLAAY